MNNINQKKFNNYSTKNKILTIAEKLFTKYSYSSVSMNDIAKLVKTTKAALYYHFKSKEDLFSGILNSSFDEFIFDIDKVLVKKNPIEKKFHDLILAYVEFSLQKRNLAKLIMQKMSKNNENITKLVTNLKNKIADCVEPLAKELLKHKKLSKNIDSRFFAFSIIGSLNSVISNEINSKELSPKKIADQMTYLFL